MSSRDQRNLAQYANILGNVGQGISGWQGLSPQQESYAGQLGQQAQPSDGYQLGQAPGQQDAFGNNGVAQPNNPYGPPDDQPTRRPAVTGSGSAGNTMNTIENVAKVIGTVASIAQLF